MDNQFLETHFNKKDIKKLSTKVVPTKGKNLNCRGITIITKFHIGNREMLPVMAKDGITIVNVGGVFPIIETRKRFHVAPFHKSLIKY